MGMLLIYVTGMLLKGMCCYKTVIDGRGKGGGGTWENQGNW